MAENSKREQIIKFIENEVLAIGSFKTSERRMLSYSELEDFAVTQLPAVAVVGRLPIPKEKIKGRQPGGVDLIISTLTVDLMIYFQDRKSPDAMVSKLLDDLWKKLYTDQLKGGLVISTLLKPREKQEYWPPYGAFGLSVICDYKHTTGGI